MTSDAQLLVIERTLTRRAEELAKPREQGREEERDRLNLLEVELPSGRYALPIEGIEAVGRLGETVGVPQTPPHIVGVIRRQGEILTLVDLDRFFLPAQGGTGDAEFFVVARLEGARFAFLISEVIGVTTLTRSRFLAPPEGFAPHRVGFLDGVSAEGVQLLALPRILLAPGFIVKRAVA